MTFGTASRDFTNGLLSTAEYARETRRAAIRRSEGKPAAEYKKARAFFENQARLIMAGQPNCYGI